MSNKINTSIQYQLSNIILYQEIIGNWLVFKPILEEGPEAIKKYLVEKWDEIKEKVKDNDQILINDIDREVTIHDFDARLIDAEDGTHIFVFTFPDYNFNDSTSKYTALALTKGIPRYFTLEYSINLAKKEDCFVVGEIAIEKNSLQHRNYGTIEKADLSTFVICIADLLKNNK